MTNRRLVEKLAVFPSFGSAMLETVPSTAVKDMVVAGKNEKWLNILMSTKLKKKAVIAYWN